MSYQPLRWHIPELDPQSCAAGTMTDRERLGLPDHFVMTDLQSRVIAATADLRGASVATLIGMIADGRAALSSRIAAGNILALAGDPRIVAFSPKMIVIPGGEVSIGLEPDQIDPVVRRLAHLGIVQSWIAKEVPRHTVPLRAYAMARFPVTNAEYRAFLNATGHCELPSSWNFRRYPAERANHPVYTVSAAAADAYAAWLAKCTGRAFRLPTEAEWEHAAAGPQACEYPWGDSFDPALCNTAECGLLDTSPVGAFVGGESPFGLCDMGGNVEEYVADDYAPWPGGTMVADHLVQIHGRYRVARGGGFSRFGDLARTRRRHGHNPRSATYAMGFRLAETL
jgi:formylglycine-generating enzyme required for sulfatase activity